MPRSRRRRRNEDRRSSGGARPGGGFLRIRHIRRGGDEGGDPNEKAQINEADLAQVQVSLGESSSDYLAEDSSPIGTYVLHAIAKGELISINALSDTSREMRSEQVPISVRGSDIPSDIELGEAINIYWVPEAMGMQKVGEPALVISGAYLRSMDRKSANFGTDVALTISVFNREIFALLSATSTGRLVVVRSNG